VPFAKAFFGFAGHNEKRRDRRALSPSLELSFDGGSHRTVDWSLSGAQVADYYGPRGLGEEVEGLVQVHTSIDSHPFKAVVVRRDSATGQLGLNFTKLSDSAFSLLEAVLMGHHGI
jgi:PilZ domain